MSSAWPTFFSGSICKRSPNFDKSSGLISPTMFFSSLSRGGLGSRAPSGGTGRGWPGPGQAISLTPGWGGHVEYRVMETS